MEKSHFRWTTFRGAGQLTFQRLEVIALFPAPIAFLTDAMVFPCDDVGTLEKAASVGFAWATIGGRRLPGRGLCASL
ncbi:MAG: hypothetical protein WB755_11220 [Terriglobales bacterium]